MWVKWRKVIIKCYLICEARKMTVLSGFTWFLIVLGKIQDGDHIWWCHSLPAGPSPIKYTSFCWEDQKFCSEDKIVSKCWNIKIENGGGYDFTWTSEGWYWVTGKTKHKANKPPICPDTQIHVFFTKRNECLLPSQDNFYQLLTLLLHV